jgi:Tol biopolymer transport system component
MKIGQLHCRKLSSVALMVVAWLWAGPVELSPASTGALPGLTPMPRDTLDLRKIPYKIVYETYRKTDGKDNWELYMMNADGSAATNLTNTPDIDEMYPHVSPDGTKICFVADEGDGQDKVRHVYYMDIDGSNRVHVATNGREPCWCFDGKSIAYLAGEYNRYTTREYATAELMYYHLDGAWTSPHRNTELHHLYAICWSPDGKWLLGVVHGGMSYSDTILAFDAYGKRVFDLAKWGVKGCRPDLNVDGTKMVWGETDWNLRIADIDLTADRPEISNLRDIVRCDRRFKVYHVDISPDSRYVTFSYGPFSGGQQVGGMAPGWNICVGDLNGTWVQITTDGNHNKEPDWVPIPAAGR